MSSKFWDKHSKQYDYKVSKRGSEYQKLIQETVPLLSHSDTVLDFGCASGEIALGLVPHVARLHGIDMSEQMIALAKSKVATQAVDNLSFEKSDIFDESLTDNSYSTVLSFYILHLLSNPPAALGRLNSLLQPGGQLIAITPCLGESSWIMKILLVLFQKMGSVPTISYFTVEQLEAKITAAGFEIIQSRSWSKKFNAQWIVARKG